MTLLNVSRTTQFKRDTKRALKRGKDPKKLKAIMLLLAANETLPAKFRDHALIGKYSGSRECHLESDWLLVYTKTEDTIIFERTGSHADLFD